MLPGISVQKNTGWFMVAWLLLANTVPIVAVPQYLACGADNQTMMRPGSHIMGQEVGGQGPGSLRIDTHHLPPHDHAAGGGSYQPGEKIMLELTGMPDGDMSAPTPTPTPKPKPKPISQYWEGFDCLQQCALT